MPNEPATLRLWPDLGAAAEARRFVRDHCVGLSDDLTDQACLLTSELVTNAILHGRTMITVAVAMDPASSRVSVAVRDDNADELPTLPPRPTVAGTTAEGGRGLGIVSALAGACGVTPVDDGKTVWFRLP